MTKTLASYIESLRSDMGDLPEERKKKLREVTQYIQNSLASEKLAKLIFICTHNSRRSHLCQVWAATAAWYYGLSDKVETYSGGTEVTAFNPRAVAALSRAGFTIDAAEGNNPRYAVHFADNEPPLTCYSKKFDDPENPLHNFAAVMTCSDAEEACPFIPGASQRISLTYRDPKEADDREDEREVYDERCRQIAREMWFCFSQVAY